MRQPDRECLQKCLVHHLGRTADRLQQFRFQFRRFMLAAGQNLQLTITHPAEQGKKLLFGQSLNCSLYFGDSRHAASLPELQLRGNRLPPGTLTLSPRAESGGYGFLLANGEERHRLPQAARRVAAAAASKLCFGGLGPAPHCHQTFTAKGASSLQRPAN